MSKTNPKDTVKARELVDADVGFISLVGRGANGEPFRVVKSEDGMSINLTGLFPVRKAAPAVAFVAIAKGYDLEQAKTLLETHDLITDDVQETEEATIFKQGDFNPDKVEILKVSDAVVIGVTGAGVQKMFEDLNFTSTDFKEVIAQSGAMPMIYMAKMALGDTIGNIMRNAGDREESVSLVKSAITDFSSFVEGVLKGVPETAFKMDAELQETPIKKSDLEGEGTDAPNTDTSEQVASDEDADDVEKGGKGKKKPYKEDDPDGKEAMSGKGKDKDKMDGKAKKSDDDEPQVDAASVSDAALDRLTNLVADLGEQIQKGNKQTSDAMADLNSKVDAVSGRVEKAESALNGTLIGGAEPDEVVKSDDDGDDDAGFVDFTSIDTSRGNPFGDDTHNRH